MTDLVLADLTALAEMSAFDAHYAKLPAFRKEKVDAYRFFEDKVRSLGAFVLLQNVMEQHGFSTLPEIVFSKDGKPDFPQNTGFHFSLSHSGMYALCAISTDVVGCDVEKIDARHRHIAKRFFTTAEQTYIESGNADERFTILWTMKESIAKKTGKGITDIEHIHLDCAFGTLSSPFCSLFHGITDDGYAYSCAYQTDKIHCRQMTI